MDLELKHIAPYLSFDLKCNIMGIFENDTHVTPKVFEIIGANKYWIEVNWGKTTTEHFPYKDVFPILKPFPDLRQGIFIGQKIVIPVYNSKLEDIHFGFQFANGEDSLNLLNSLFENHFDVYNLIGNKLAVSNTENVTPF